MSAKTWRVYRGQPMLVANRYNVWAELEDSDEAPILVAEDLTEEEAAVVIRNWTPPVDTR